MNFNKKDINNIELISKLTKEKDKNKVISSALEISKFILNSIRNNKLI